MFIHAADADRGSDFKTVSKYEAKEDFWYNETEVVYLKRELK